MAKKKSILFISNADKILKSAAIDNGYIIRDPSAYIDGEFIEQCDVVSGDAPTAYKANAEYIDASELAWLRLFIAEPNQKPTRKTRHVTGETISGDS